MVRHVTVGALSTAVALGVWGTAPTAHAAAQAQAPTNVRPEVAQATPKVMFMSKSWRTGNRVTIKATGMKPGKKVTFAFRTAYWPEGSQPTLAKTAVANRAGVATISLPWPAAKGLVPYWEVQASDSPDYAYVTYAACIQGRWVATNKVPESTVAFSSKTWRSGAKVTLTARGETPGKPVSFVFAASPPGGPLTPLATWKAVANSKGVASVTVTWPTAPVQRQATYWLRVTDAVGLRNDTEFVNDGGTWVPGGVIPPVDIKVPSQRWSPGAEVPMAVQAPPGLAVEFRVKSWKGDVPTTVATVNATASAAGLASATVTWPADAEGVDLYSIEAVTAQGNTYVTWVHREEFEPGQWTNIWPIS